MRAVYRAPTRRPPMTRSAPPSKDRMVTGPGVDCRRETPSYLVVVAAGARGQCLSGG
jgi:hypothetical protein